MDQPVLRCRVKRLITVDGLTFRDLDGDGQLAPYEDWRLPVSERVADLVGRMTVPEKAGLLLITSHYMGGSTELAHYLTGGEPVTSADGLLNESRVEIAENIFAAPGTGFRKFDPPSLDVAASTEGIMELGLRYLIVRDNPPVDKLAVWSNRLQEIAEGSRLGIPVVLVSNPRNHVSDIGAFGQDPKMSAWPGELGLAATRDPDLVRRFGEIAAQQWRAAGLTKGYMYMADVATEPRWYRCEGTFGEDPELVAQMTAAVIKGFQGEQLNPSSVSLTTKHFPGGGPRDRGTDPHFEHGQNQPYPTPGSLYTYHLPPFKAAIEAGTTSIMPYYARTNNALSVNQLDGGRRPFAEVGFAFDDYLLTQVLRKELGFTGYINSDTGITTDMPWGVMDLTRPERIAKAMKAGTNCFAGDGNPAVMLAAIEQGLVSESMLDTSVTLMLAEMMRLGLFENPYVDPAQAQVVVDNPAHLQVAAEAHRKSIVLLRNDQQVLPLTCGARVFVEVVGPNAQALTAKARGGLAIGGLALTDSLADATHALVWVRPQLSLMTDMHGRPLSVDLGRETGVDVDRIKQIERTRPTILVVNCVNPWVLSEVEPDAVAVLATFGVREFALAEVLTGACDPVGRLPLTLPASMAAVIAKPSDIPGWAGGDDYPYRNAVGDAYRFGFGLGY